MPFTDEDKHVTLLQSNARVHPSEMWPPNTLDLNQVDSVFIIGIYKGIFPPPQSLIFPHKNLRIRQKSATCAAKSFELLGENPSDPLNRGSALDPAGETTPGPSAVASIQWCPRCPDTPVFGRVVSKYMCKKASTFGGLLPPDLYRRFAPEPHWGLPKFRSPAPLAALSGNESVSFSLRLCFSNDVFMVG